jgi:hypothetical protein
MPPIGWTDFDSLLMVLERRLFRIALVDPTFDA